MLTVKTPHRSVAAVDWLRKHWPIITILLFSFFMRLYKLDSNAPFFYWHDENNYVETALRFGTGTIKPHAMQHGMLLSMIFFAEYVLYYGIQCLAGVYHSPVDLLREYIVDPTGFYMMSRVTILLFSMGCILLVYRIASKLYSRLIANLAALMYSISLVPFIKSKWTKEDMVATFFLLLAFLTCNALWACRCAGKKPFLRYYVWAGLCVGLASAAKMSAVFGFAFIIVIHLMAYRPEAGRNRVAGYLAHAFDSAMLVCGTFFIVGFLLGNPYALIDPYFFYDNVTTLNSQMIDPTCVSWKLYFSDHLSDVLGGRFLEAAVLISCIFFIIKRSKRALALLAYPVVFYLFYMNYPGFAHYLVPAVPFLLIITSAFFGEILEKRPRKIVIMVVVAVMAIALVPPFLNALRYNALVAADDTRTLAARWIEKNVPDNAVIVSEGYISTSATHVPIIKGNLKTLNRDLAAIKASGGSGVPTAEEIEYAQVDDHHRRYDIYKRVNADPRELEKLRPDYVILTGYNDMNVAQREYLKEGDYYAKRRALYEGLARGYRLIKEFDPYPEFSCFFPIFLVGDLQKLAKVDPIKDANALRQGPRIQIYIRNDRDMR